MKTPGFVGYDNGGRFVHYCHCGEWGAFGVGVSLLRDQLGIWYCLEHRPPPAPEPTPVATPPPPEAPPLPPLTPSQGKLL